MDQLIEDTKLFDGRETPSGVSMFLDFVRNEGHLEDHRALTEQLEDSNPDKTLRHLLNALEESRTPISDINRAALESTFRASELRRFKHNGVAVFLTGTYFRDTAQGQVNILVVTTEPNPEIEKLTERKHEKGSERHPLTTISYISTDVLERYAQQIDQNELPKDLYYEAERLFLEAPGILAGDTSLFNDNDKSGESIEKIRETYTRLVAESPIVSAYCRMQLNSGMF